MAGLGLATASLAVFLVSKKGRKDILGVLLIGSLGASTFVPYGTFAFENKELLSYNQTISASTHEGLAEGISTLMVMNTSDTSRKQNSIHQDQLQLRSLSCQ